MLQFPKNESSCGCFYNAGQEYVITFNVVNNTYVLYKVKDNCLTGISSNQDLLTLLRQLDE